MLTVSSRSGVGRFRIEWRDGFREPQCPPNPRYPQGIDLDVAGDQAAVACVVALPYPARRCGHYEVRCRTCGLSVALTTAGRPDDPRSVRLPCKEHTS